MTFHEFGKDRLRSLCQAVGFHAKDTEAVQRLFTFMTSSWGWRRIGETPAWASDITDDHTPFELSLAIEDNEPEVRFLFENQSHRTTLKSTWDEGLCLNERLNHKFGVPLDRFNLIHDLFEPHDHAARFALWYAVCFKPGKKPAFKAYFNPEARGPEQRSAVINEALSRLGFENAWRFISDVAMRRGSTDKPSFFSLDLAAHSAARVKVYVAHKAASAHDLEAILSHSRDYVEGEASAYYRQLVQGNEGRVTSRPAHTCMAFTSNDDERPASVTMHVPVRCHVTDDQSAMDRMSGVLEPRAFDLLERAVNALTRRPLEASTGLIQWASMRCKRGKPRTTFYLSTEAYGGSMPHPAKPRAVAASAHSLTRALS